MLIGTHGARLIRHGKHVPAKGDGGDYPVSEGALSSAPSVRRGRDPHLMLELVLPLRELEKVTI